MHNHNNLKVVNENNVIESNHNNKTVLKHMLSDTKWDTTIGMTVHGVFDSRARFSLEPDPARPTRHEITVVMKTENGMHLKAIHRRAGHSLE